MIRSMTEMKAREVEEVIYLFARAVHDAAIQQRIDVLEEIQEYSAGLAEIESDEITMLPEAWAEIAECAESMIGAIEEEDSKEILKIVEIAASVADIGTMPMVMFHAYRDFDGTVFPDALQSAIEIMKEDAE
jgi:hypothetical protein